MGKKKKVLSNTSGHAYQTEKKKKKEKSRSVYGQLGTRTSPFSECADVVQVK